VDPRSWGKNWNEAALRRIVNLPQQSPSRRWPLFGMLALGLVAGVAIGGYAASQRSQMKRLANYAHRLGDELSGHDEAPVKPLAVVTSPRSNHRRKAAVKV
jgi:hypothetical protein